MGKGVVATRTTGSEDYVIDGETGFLTAPGSVTEMRDRIEQLWWDDALRQRLGATAAHYASEHFSDGAAGMALGRILDKVAEEVGQF
jgi:glycosyltransferase involved in cell wall biosynthesis